MRRMVIIILAICFIITGCMNKGKTITLTQIKDSFEKNGVSMSEVPDLHPESVFSKAYNDVTPRRFVIDENQKISIYVYTSSKEVRKGIKDFENKTAAADLTPHTIYQIANVLIFYVTDESFKDVRVDLAIEELLSLTK
ncbi:hypothetical protein [Paenibacillus prosopidis]|uniref:Lipoprotein n=1 Tax=Paenibacillus prosopidis TaxID=630520 RepID=A0A368VX28_9BACL|nr:hypothetical protein [Paenibacillus prosopidis]RCW46460.1 hypothetical protein DFP97_109103 [Paenibacillus prosopidis]